MNIPTTSRFVFTALVGLAACGDDGGSADDGSNDVTGNAATTDPSSMTDSDGGEPATTMTGIPPATDDGDESSSDGSGGTGQTADCRDAMILDLGLIEGTVSEGAVTNEAVGSGWMSVVDGTAGGIADAPTNPWIYLRFTPQGLERVDIDDLEALDSAEWDIAAKRFGVRLNSGVSGPSTVSAAALVDMAYEDVTALPGGTPLGQEAFYDAECNLVDDGSGQGAPNYLMTPWWSYAGCVGTTLTPFVIELADGSHVKFVIDAYYASGQDGCNMGGAMGMGSAMFTWRWEYL